MPHDARGRLIERGDWIKVRPLNATEEYVCGRVVKLQAMSSQVCSGEVRWVGLGQLEQDYFDAQDSTLLVKADGSEVGDFASQAELEPEVIGGA